MDFKGALAKFYPPVLILTHIIKIGRKLHKFYAYAKA